jgi:regulator of replication initiation timing
VNVILEHRMENEDEVDYLKSKILNLEKQLSSVQKEKQELDEENDQLSKEIEELEKRNEHSLGTYSEEGDCNSFID